MTRPFRPIAELCTASARAAGRLGLPERRFEESPLSRMNKVALVVDDESFARLFAVQVLLDLGFYVLEAADADEGIELLHDNEDVALVFTDISMPGALDGVDLARHVRAVRPDAALLVTSGHSLPPGTEAEVEAAFLPKPYTASILIDAIRRHAGPGPDPRAGQTLQAASISAGR